MKHSDATLCPIHGLKTRIDLCADCARFSAKVAADIPQRHLELTQTCVGRVERYIDERGHIAFRLTRPIPVPVSATLPWAFAR